MNEKKIKFIDLFAGVGGFHKGLEQANDSFTQPQTRKPKKGRNGASDEQSTRIYNRQHTTLGCVGNSKPYRKISGQKRNFVNTSLQEDKQRSPHNGAGGFASQDKVQEIGCKEVRGSGKGYNETTRGLRCGGQPSKMGFECVWANEWDKHAASIYKKRFPEAEFFEGDIRNVKADDIGEADLLCAGFPCQSFSLAGKRKGFEEARGTLFYEICRIAKAKRIPYLLLENVKGLLSA